MAEKTAEKNVRFFFPTLYLHRHSNQFEKNLNQTAETENFFNDVNDIVSISTCEFCRIEFDSQDLMRDHIDAMHVEEVLSNCTNCDFVTDSKLTLEEHTQVAHPFQCDT